jgi:tryptophan-rich sensory protein
MSNISTMKDTRDLSTATSKGASPAGAALLASGAFLVPLALSASSSPSPNHPATLAWYKSLQVPFFKPPDWAVPIAWSAIQSALASAAYRLLRAPPSAARSRALALLGWNVTMIGAWSRLFFGRRALAASTAAAVTMVATGVAYVNEAKRVDERAARAGVPFVAWVAFATLLTASLWRLNARRER